MSTSTGYGPSSNTHWQNLLFDGDERKFELWEAKFLGYMKIKKLKNIFVGDDDVTGLMCVCFGWIALCVGVPCGLAMCLHLLLLAFVFLVYANLWLAMMM